MELIVWKDSLNLGFKEIDDQHRKLVAMINKLFDAMSAGKSKEVMQVVFSELSNYIVVHFGAEEKLMKQYGYEEYEYHKQEHAYFIEKLNELKLKFNSGNTSISLDVLNFLKDWLLKHIMGTDRKYVRLFSSKGHS
jgi:hemerythrin-like metal-binding protein